MPWLARTERWPTDPGYLGVIYLPLRV